MGRGNYLPSPEMGEHELVYVDGEFDEEQRDQLVAEIYAALPGSFYEVHEWRQHDSVAIARNRLLDICIADNEWSKAVFVVPREGLVEYPSELNLAYRHLANTAKRLFGKLAELYLLRKRAGPWCSAPYA